MNHCAISYALIKPIHAAYYYCSTDSVHVTIIINWFSVAWAMGCQDFHPCHYQILLFFRQSLFFPIHPQLSVSAHSFAYSKMHS